MRVQMTARGGLELTPECREQVRRRIHFALGRFAGRIERVSVRLADINGPRGGLDKVCAIQVEGELRSPVIVREGHGSVHGAVAAAAGRAERGVARGLRLQDRARHSGVAVLWPDLADRREE